MKNFFDIDAFPWRWLCRLADLMLLNLLFLICCIPGFTVGPALSALYSVCLKMAEGDDPGIIKAYFCAFRRNFRQSAILWLIMAGIGVLLWINWFCLGVLPEAPAACMKVLHNILLLIYIGVFSYLFPIQCKFENSVKNTFKNAFALAARHFIPCTLPICALNLAPVILLQIGSEAAITVLTFCLWFLFSGIAFLNSRILLQIFRKYISSGSRGS